MLLTVIANAIAALPVVALAIVATTTFLRNR